ncbi:MAG: hypothetical protein ABIF28_17095 [Pseudomonadota bacterium]
MLPPLKLPQPPVRKSPSICCQRPFCAWIVKLPRLTSTMSMNRSSSAPLQVGVLPEGATVASMRKLMLNRAPAPAENGPGLVPLFCVCTSTRMSAASSGADVKPRPAASSSARDIDEKAGSVMKASSGSWAGDAPAEKTLLEP